MPAPFAWKIRKPGSPSMATRAKSHLDHLAQQIQLAAASTPPTAPSNRTMSLTATLFSFDSDYPFEARTTYTTFVDASPTLT